MISRLQNLGHFWIISIMLVGIFPLLASCASSNSQEKAAAVSSKIVDCGAVPELSSFSASPPLTGLVASPPKMQANTDTSAGSPAVRLSGVDKSAESSGTPGIYLPLTEEFEKSASCRRVRVEILARAPRTGAAKRFAVAYSTNEAGNSGWNVFSLARTPEKYIFEFDVPTMKQGLGDYLGFLPDVDGTGGAVEILAVNIAIIPRATQ